jgi:hypothetical protein
LSLVYSTRLGLANLAPAAGLTTLYTVPSGKRAVVKCVTVYPATGVASTAVMVIAGLAALIFACGATTSTIERELSIVLNAGETLQWLCTGGQTAVTVSGYVLTA